MFITVKAFTDKLDKHVYEVGDYFPHNINKGVSTERANELIEAEVIAPTEVPENALNQIYSGQEDFPKHKGGGYYELSNGETVQGKDAAIAAEEELKAGE